MDSDQNPNPTESDTFSKIQNLMDTSNPIVSDSNFLQHEVLALEKHSAHV